MSDLIVGIDLGTTNSEVAAFAQGKVQVLGPGESRILPSCVGISAAGELLVGEAARNQYRLYPERTVRSIKRRMGTTEKVNLGEQSFLPEEISALILRELVNWAERSLGRRPERAVITVPAYFSDAQRNATRQAGELAGLDVVRILNEPTAASLAYGHGDGSAHTAMVYDLGGGTFDVSIVTTHGEITEVLASHGNNRLGGDDFDELLMARLAREFEKQNGVTLLEENRAAYARLRWASEQAKKQLSFEPYARIREDALLVHNGKPLHLETEISREEYESMIRPLVETTFDSVSKALRDSGKRPSELDAVLLVGGSTRTPLISDLLREHFDLEPRQDVHPDLCVALGAGVLASRLAGKDVERVLVDVSPYTFGVSYLGERGGVPYPHCYKPIIQRNTPLPLTRTEKFYTAGAFQAEVEIDIFQGDDPDALNNLPVGEFRIRGLTEMEEPNEVHCRMRLDLDGILEVTAIEKSTGKSKNITISNALKERSAEELAAARKRLQKLYATRPAEMEADWEELAEEAAEPQPEPLIPTTAAFAGDASALVARARTLLDSMHPDDREETINLIEDIEQAVNSGDAAAYQKAAHALGELLFFVGGKE